MLSVNEEPEKLEWYGATEIARNTGREKLL